MAKSTRKTEFHKSTNPERNSKAGLKHRCNECNRLFEDDVNLTLHLYWHTCNSKRAIARDLGQHDEDEDDDQSDEEDPNTISTAEDGVFNFKASPGWLKNFMVRQNVATLKMKGEKGDADYEAVDKWVHDWLTKFYQHYIQYYPMPFRQAFILVVNFDEAGFQYKSIPQYSLVK